jgi:hypothetical protein
VVLQWALAFGELARELRWKYAAAEPDPPEGLDEEQ